MKKILHFVISPYIQALLLTIFFLLIFQNPIPKFYAKEISSELKHGENFFHFDDLDRDGNSETISTFHNLIGNAGLTLYKGTAVVEQWSFHGTFGFHDRKSVLITGDRDGDNSKEIYVFTTSNDSIFLHSIKNFTQVKLEISSRFISTCGVKNGKIDPNLIPAEMEDLNGDGIKELIFGIGTGFSIKPRRVFAYDIPNDSLIGSPESSYNILNILQLDVCGDSLREIIPWGYACCNIHDSSVKFHDRSSWLMVFDKKLNFKSEPIEFKGQYSMIYPLAIQEKSKSIDNNKFIITVFFCPPFIKGDSTLLIKINQDGKIIKQKKLSNKLNSAIALNSKNEQSLALIINPKVGLELYDGEFKCKKVVRVENISSAFAFDVDLDGDDEALAISYGNRSIYIFRHDLSDPVELKFDGQVQVSIYYTLYFEKGKPPLLALTNGNQSFLYEYGLNPLYKYRFAIWVSVYLAILLFILLIRNIQQYQINKRNETKNKITSLQLQIVRNQLDPHFIMNAINSIIASIHLKEKEEAAEHLMQFSKLHRSLLLSSDQIERNLKDEIEFTKNYLALEKLRFRDKFDFKICIDPAVNMDIQIPKMILQIHVENAIKHGLSLKKDKGEIIINCNRDANKLVIEIKDNGVGREYTSTYKERSTGKGQSTMNQFTQLYNTYKKQDISTEVIDLYDYIGNPTGTMVRIIIPNGHEKK